MVLIMGIKLNITGTTTVEPSYSVTRMWFDALPPKGDFQQLNLSSPEQISFV